MTNFRFTAMFTQLSKPETGKTCELWELGWALGILKEGILPFMFIIGSEYFYRRRRRALFPLYITRYLHKLEIRLHFIFFVLCLPGFPQKIATIIGRSMSRASIIQSEVSEYLYDVRRNAIFEDLEVVVAWQQKSTDFTL